MRRIHLFLTVLPIRHLTDLSLGRTMAWSKVQVSDFSIKIKRGKGEATFAIKNTTKFSLGVVNQYLAKRPAPNILEALNFLNHLFSVGPTCSLIPVGRKFFTAADTDIKKFEIIEFRKGLFQAVHFGGDKSLTINVDITTGVFWNSDFVTAIDLACRFLGMLHSDLTSKRVTTLQLNQLNRVLRGIKFRVLHRGEMFSRRQHTISKLVKKSSREHTFQLNGDRPRTISVEEYMHKTYSIKLKYPDAPLIMKGDSTYLPLELCYIIQVFSYLLSLI